MLHQNKFIPTQNTTKYLNPRPEWFTPEISRAIRKRNIIYRKKKHNNSPALIASYTIARREVKKCIKRAKKNYEINIAKESTTNPKKIL